MYGDTQHCRASPAKAHAGKGSYSCTVWWKCVLFRVPISKDGTMPIFPVHLRFLGVSERGRQMLNSTGQSQPLLRNPHSQVTDLQTAARSWLSRHVPAARLAPCARCPASCGMPAPSAPHLLAGGGLHPLCLPLP